MEKEDKILLAAVQDKIDQCLEYYIPSHTAFLDARQIQLVENYCRKIKELRYTFDGGFEEAERKVCLFLPDEEPMDTPIGALNIQKKGPKPLTHRDYLGSILGLGIKREQIGDIIVKPDGADIVIMKDLTDFFVLNYDKVGSTSVVTKGISTKELVPVEGHMEEVRLTVSSMRVDNLVAGAFGLSRGNAAEAIQGGIVYVNGVQTTKTDKNLSLGDKLVLRGKGKIILHCFVGKTRKDKIVILIKKFG